MKRFYSRHPALTIKKGARKDPRRFVMTRKVMEDWYAFVLHVMDKNNIS